MDKTIRVIGLDCFKTALLETQKYESPYRHMIDRLWMAHRRGEVIAKMRHRILTTPLLLQDIAEAAEELNLPIENGRELDAILLEAQALLRKQLEPDTFQRNPEFERLKEFADNRGIMTAIVSDLALPYGALVDEKLHDMPNRFYSFDIGYVKAEWMPFHILSDHFGVADEETLFIGDNVNSDYLAAKDAGLHALWYVPDPSKEKWPDLAPFFELYKDDIVTSLDEVVPTLQRRGFTFGL